MKPEFRAWYKPDFKTKDGPLLFEQKRIHDGMYFVHTDEILDPNGLRYPFEIPWLDDDWILEQWTYQHDKNGDKVFVGDIIEYVDHHKTKYFEIKFENNTYSDVLGYHPIDKDGQHMAHYGGWQDEEYKVIGNIHQNKDLLV